MSFAYVGCRTTKEMQEEKESRYTRYRIQQGSGQKNSA